MERHQSIVLKSSATAIDSFESPNPDDTAKYHRETAQPGSVIDESSTTKQTASQRGAVRKSRHNHKAAWGSSTGSQNSELEKPGHNKALAYELGLSPVVDPAESYFEHEIEESDMRQYPSPTKQQNSTSRHRSSQDHSFLTYDEELLFLHSDSILKRLQSCTEQCKDIITILTFAFRSSLTLDTISARSANAREIALWNTLSAFEKKFPCLMPDSLDLVQRFAKEITANFKVGVFKSPESALLKQGVAHASGHNHLSNSTSSPTVEVSSDPSRFGFHSRPSTLVALLRTAKMALCIARRVDTAKLRDVPIHDVQVYMA
ncbi:MAG: hypothetical protein Q9173_004332 [Seirophora scorigena]